MRGMVADEIDLVAHEQTNYGGLVVVALGRSYRIFFPSTTPDWSNESITQTGLSVERLGTLIELVR